MQRRIVEDDPRPPVFENIAAAAMLVRQFPEPPTPEEKKLQGELRALLDCTAAQQAASSAQHRRGSHSSIREREASVRPESRSIREEDERPRRWERHIEDDRRHGRSDNNGDVIHDAGDVTTRMKTEILVPNQQGHDAYTPRGYQSTTEVLTAHLLAQVPRADKPRTLAGGLPLRLRGWRSGG